LVFSIGIIEFPTSRKWWFWLYFSFLHDYWPPITWNSWVHTSWCKMDICEKRAFQLLKMRQENELKHKNLGRNSLFIVS